MLARVVGSMAAAIARETTETPPASPFATALIGSGASLIGRRDKRSVGLILLAAGGLLLWREAATAARRDREARLPEALTPTRVRPAAPTPPPRAGATAWGV